MKNNQIFNNVQHPAPTGNYFDLSHSHRTTCQLGKLIPVYTEEILAGDKINIKPRNLIRLMPLATPAMDKIQVITTAFFVPFRLLWPGDASIGTGYESFFTNGGEQSGTPPPAMPQYSGSYFFPVGGFHDYLGAPTKVSMSAEKGTPFCALYRQAYDLIFWEWYRDQNLQGPEQGFDKPSITAGPTNVADDTLHTRAWPRDYYTASLPFAQKGEAISMPVSASLSGTSDVFLKPSYSGEQIIRPQSWSPGDIEPGNLLADSSGRLNSDNGTFSFQTLLDPDGSMAVDGQFFQLGAIETTINDFRTAMALQAWLELNAVGGTRFIEALKVHFGTSPLDARLQRPELIGSQFQNIAVSEVLQTSETSGESPLGSMGGHGISSNRSGLFRYHAQEPGIIMVLTSIFPEASYHQGLHRMFTRQSYFDFAWPSFAKLGEQATLKREVVAKSDPSPSVSRNLNLAVFGYMPRYCEYRFHNNQTSGFLRPGENMEAWTMTQNYSTDPAVPLELNSSFIQCKPSTRVFADTSDQNHQVIMQWGFDIQCFRLLPKYGTPSNLS